MRDTGVIRWRFKGNKDLAKRLVQPARTLMGRMKAYLDPSGRGRTFGEKLWRLDDGAQILTRYTQAGEEITIFAGGAGECQPLEAELHGLVCIAMSTTYPDCKGPANVPYLFRKPDLVLKPLNPSKPLSARTYEGFAYSGGYALPGNAWKPYAVRQADTCGHYTDWYSKKLKYGNTTWFGKDNLVLSWMGTPTRYFHSYRLRDTGIAREPPIGTWFTREVHGQQLLADDVEVPEARNISQIWLYGSFGSTAMNDKFNRYPYNLVDSFVFYRGREVKLDGDPWRVDQRVVGAGVVELNVSGKKKKYLVVVSSAGPSPLDTMMTERVWVAEIAYISVDSFAVRSPQVIKTITYPNSILAQFLTVPNSPDGIYSNPSFRNMGINITPWLFNVSGNRAVTTRFYEHPAGGHNLYRTFLDIEVLGNELVAEVSHDVVSRSFTYTASDSSNGNRDGASFSGSASADEVVEFFDFRGDALVSGKFQRSSSGSYSRSEQYFYADDGGTTIQLPGGGSYVTEPTYIAYTSSYASSGAGSSELYIDGALIKTAGEQGSSSGSSALTTNAPADPPSWSGNFASMGVFSATDFVVLGVDLRTKVVILGETTSASSSSYDTDTGGYVETLGTAKGLVIRDGVVLATSSEVTSLDINQVLAATPITTEYCQSLASGGTEYCFLIDRFIGSGSSTSLTNADGVFFNGAFTGPAPSGTVHPFFSGLNNQGTWFTWANLPTGELMVEVPLLFNNSDWETTLGKPFIRYLDGAKLTERVNIGNDEPRYFPIGVL